jgi:hypothetical protein
LASEVLRGFWDDNGDYIVKKIEESESVEASVHTRWRIESPDELQAAGGDGVGCMFYGTLYPEGTVLRKGDVTARCSGGVWVGAPVPEVLV